MSVSIARIHLLLSVWTDLWFNVCDPAALLPGDVSAMIRTLERYALTTFDILGTLPVELAVEVLKEFDVKQLLALCLVSNLSGRRAKSILILSSNAFLPRCPRAGVLSSKARNSGSSTLCDFPLAILCRRESRKKRTDGEPARISSWSVCNSDHTSTIFLQASPFQGSLLPRAELVSWSRSRRDGAQRAQELCHLARRARRRSPHRILRRDVSPTSVRDLDARSLNLVIVRIACFSRRIRVWDLPTATCKLVLKAKAVSCLAFCASANVFAAGFHDVGRTQVWSSVSWQPLQLISGHLHGIRAIDINERYLVSAGADKGEPRSSSLLHGPELAVLELTERTCAPQPLS